MLPYKNNCRFFKGDLPCEPHKHHGLNCRECSDYSPIGQQILIIKLGAAGDVIRTTPLLQKLWKEYPDYHITWVTLYPEVVPSRVDCTIKFSFENVFWLMNRKFYLLISLDKDREAIALAECITAERKYGFGMDQYGHCRAFNSMAKHKLQTGIFDDLSKVNTLSYPQEIFNICGYTFSGEKYILEKKSQLKWDLPLNKKNIGLNTGCGGRWASRLWPNDYWINLGKKLLSQNLQVIWLGGPQEHEKNTQFQKDVGGLYFGHFPLTDFISLVDACHLVVTQVTMALHIAIGLEKRVVLMNNIFNKHEFDLYGLGIIIEPDEPCSCYYKSICPHNSMHRITVDRVFDQIVRQLSFISTGS